VQSVSINGIVRSPGTYNLKTGMTLKDLILEAGGLNDNVYRYRVEVARIDPLNNNLNEYAEVINFNMDEKFSVSSASSNDGTKKEFSAAVDVFQLNSYDLVSIRSDPYFISQKQVTISGEVLYPGQYTILTSDEKITDIIERAGGLRPNAYPDASQYTRQGVKINASLTDILKKPRSKLNFKVQNGDEIVIVPHPNVVNITGEVNTVGIHKYVSGKRLRYYLNLAGGLNPDADKSNIWVEYPSGDSKKYKRWSLVSPKIIDGSSISVGKQKEAEPFDRTEFAKEVTAILANLAQTVAVVALAGR
jgi:protein involved in polysaccharide export with SLBB domain